QARAAVARVRPDVIVLDLNLPDGDGVDLCREMRAAGFRGAVIMVTARDATVDRILGLEFGADDYVVKPFEARELTARIRSALRRMADAPAGPAQKPKLAQFAGWRLDLLRRRLFAPDGRLVMLTSAEFEVLSRLAHGAGQVLARDALMPDRAATAAFDRSIDMVVSRLRQKLGVDAQGESPIVTVRRRGYLLAAEVAFA
ncbi:MAG: response regulator transcription factor, partial [Caulobacteraceae bacterium]|nr:response regulator transcription factor [Caulobacter sp.]